MNIKIVLLIMMLLALSWTSNGMDCLYLGNGSRHQVINLDAGSKLQGHNAQFARYGFASPSIPQPMALSSNVMITQAKKLMDEAYAARNESVSAKDEAKAANDEAKALLTKIEENENNIKSLLKDVEASAAKAAQAGVLFNKTDDAYKKTLAISVDVEGNMSQMKLLLEQAKGYADSSAESADQARDSQNRTSLLHNETAVIFGQCSSVYGNMTLLEKEVQDNSDNIRTWMNEKMP
jgi:hypothetical protein